MREPMAIAPPPHEEDLEALENLGHPRGTLATVAVFGLLFAIGWFATYLFIFIERGAPHH
jgi:hypothetical protein